LRLGTFGARLLDYIPDICYIYAMHDSDWIEEFRTSVKSVVDLSCILPLTDEEKNWYDSEKTLPLLISRYFLSLIDPTDPLDPIRRQVVPSRHEFEQDCGGSMDPLEEVSNSVNPRLIHRYRNRVAFLVTDTCATYCRHCFRRRFTGTSNGCASDQEVTEVVQYIGEHVEIKEMLLTGGDPLTLSDSHLEKIISSLRKARPDLILRLCTRIPATFPSRVTESLIAMLKKYRSAPLFVMVQFNHPREITPQSTHAVGMFIDAGVPAFNQTVLLRGVNDNVDVLEDLMNALVAIRVKPYYLFQGDLVSGTAHFRVPLEKGLFLEAELRKRLSGLAMPVYAVDLPQGGGKVPLGKAYLQGRNDKGAWVFHTPDGSVRTYPDPAKVIN
jgi:lysine 2,3-aminomutase